MRTSGDKKATTLRLTAAVKAQLENVARMQSTSESHVTEVALTEYFKNHGYTTRYVMKASKERYSLIKINGDNIDVLDLQVRNGVSMEAIREAYRSQYQAPVDLVIDEGASK